MYDSLVSSFDKLGGKSPNKRNFDFLMLGTTKSPINVSHDPPINTLYPFDLVTYYQK